MFEIFFGKIKLIENCYPVSLLPFDVSEKNAENLFELGAKYYWRDKEKEIDFLNNSLEVKQKLARTHVG